MRRWNFPFKSVEIAKLYLRTADITTQQSCGIYEVISATGRKSYKIFSKKNDFLTYLEKSRKTASTLNSLFQKEPFSIFPNTQIKKLTSQEIDNYLK